MKVPTGGGFAGWMARYKASLKQKSAAPSFSPTIIPTPSPVPLKPVTKNPTATPTFKAFKTILTDDGKQVDANYAGCKNAMHYACRGEGSENPEGCENCCYSAPGVLHFSCDGSMCFEYCHKEAASDVKWSKIPKLPTTRPHKKPHQKTSAIFNSLVSMMTDAPTPAPSPPPTTTPTKGPTTQIQAEQADLERYRRAAEAQIAGRAIKAEIAAQRLEEQEEEKRDQEDREREKHPHVKKSPPKAHNIDQRYHVKESSESSTSIDEITPDSFFANLNTIPNSGRL